MGKLYEQYIYKFYLTASHSILTDNEMGPIHSHTWEITLDITNTKNNYIEFSEIEKKVEQILSVYQKKYLNDISPLDKINPTLENLCEFFKNLLQVSLAKMGFVLLMVEMSETASRSYIINLVQDSEDEDFDSKFDEMDKMFKSVELESFLDNLYDSRT